MSSHGGLTGPPRSRAQAAPKPLPSHTGEPGGRPSQHCLHGPQARAVPKSLTSALQQALSRAPQRAGVWSRGHFFAQEPVESGREADLRPLWGCREALHRALSFLHGGPHLLHRGRAWVVRVASQSLWLPIRVPTSLFPSGHHGALSRPDPLPRLKARPAV